ncbi:putative phosphoribosyl-AMP cyclohydrolase [Candidatus Zinderia insecticola CARI]|uniref:Histidine biosynthesis bifunctional protein HisIE n=1 Tax=Zinderia insecticola (strain CARI) TaxID=871271 RepID=E0TJ07_ZINIC|nr:putative phosphoribosyl-AMP cyclohydrolase [Candidatus Zinderia insecticola CARI]
MKIKIIKKIKWNNKGLIPVITQDIFTKKILMLAWMNKKSLEKTIKNKEAFYWSRKRKEIWYKGKNSGCIQKVYNIYLDCDKDCLLLIVKQILNYSCHTGKKTCFYNKIL